MKDLKERLAAFFKANPNVQTAYVTSDGNIFSAYTYAHNWSTYFTNKTIEEYHSREFVALKNKNSNTENKNDNEPLIDVSAVTDSEREELIKRHIELFDTKPAYNISIEKLKEKVEAAEKPLYEASKAPSETPSETPNN